MRSAVALWRVKGVDDTTVAEICRAAGVSKGLFYFYFERKEDILIELGMLSVEAVSNRIRELFAAEDYDVLDVIHESLLTMERAMRPNPPELVARTVLEGYRRRFELEQAADGGRPLTSTLAELYGRAVADGKLPASVDVGQLAHVTQLLVTEGARRWPGWAEGAFADEITDQVRLVIRGAIALSGD